MNNHPPNYTVKLIPPMLGTRVFSYSTCIKQVLPSGLTIGNVTYYSRATGRHQVLAECDKCTVLLGNVIQETYNLLPVAISRGLIADGEKINLLERESHERSQKYYHWLADGARGDAPGIP